MTTQERALWQTFPEDFVFKGSRTEAELLIGNAVPVNQARLVGDCLIKFIRKGAGQ